MEVYSVSPSVYRYKSHSDKAVYSISASVYKYKSHSGKAVYSVWAGVYGYKCSVKQHRTDVDKYQLI